MIPGSGLTSGELQSRTQQTKSAVEEPYDFGDTLPGLPSAFSALASTIRSGLSAIIAKGKIASNPMYLSDCFMRFVK